jgi:colicin import membrane protein
VTFGLTLSILLHAALLGYALLSIGLTAPREPKEPVEAIIADVITESDLNRMRKGVREAKLDAAQPKDVKDPDQAKKEPPKPRPAGARKTRRLGKRELPKATLRNRAKPR